MPGAEILGDVLKPLGRRVRKVAGPAKPASPALRQPRQQAAPGA